MWKLLIIVGGFAFGILEIPPVESAETALRVQIVKDAKGKK
jgi:hypothetical protein